MARIRVLSIFRSKLTEVRGTPIRVRSLLERLDKRDDIELISCTWDEHVDFLQHHVSLSNRHVSDLVALFRLIRRHNIDVIVGHTTASAYYLVPLALLTRAKIMLEMHGFIEEEALLYGSISKFRYWIQKWWLSIFYRWCDAITTCSETATSILSHYNANVITIFGGVDVSLFHPHVASGSFVSRTPGKILIGYVGNSRVWQGLPFLARAFAALREQTDAFELVVVSSEKKHPDMGDDVRVIGPLAYTDVPRALVDCDILVIPRPANEVNRISFPSKLIEYMAMGKPVVASATSDCHKIIEHGVCGMLYEPDDLDGIVRCFLDLTSVDVRRQLGYHAAQTVQQNFTWERQAAAFAQHVQRLFL